MSKTDGHTAGTEREQGLRFVGSHMIDEIYSKSHARLPHTHENELELFYVHSGAGQYMVDNRFYEIGRGDIVICNAGVLHGEDPEIGRRICSYSVALNGISVEGLPDNWLAAGDCCPVVSCGQLAEQAGQIMRLIYLLSADAARLDDVLSSLTLSMVLLTKQLLRSRERHAVQPAANTAFALAHRARRYLDAHHREPLTLRTVAEAMHASEYYLAHVFKEEIGMPPMQYVMKRRIGEAQSLLMDTMMPIAEIADLLGYSSPCHFNTMFGKYVGLPPGRYRQSFRKKKEQA